MKQTAGDEGLYKLVSGFYGPGSMGCWYFLIASVFISWVLEPRYRFCMTNELIAVVAYPIIAAGHLLIQIVNFPNSGVQYMVVNLANFITLERDGPVKLGDVGEGEKSVGYMQYPADPSSPERTEVYPLVASIIASLHVVQSFTILALISLVSSWAETKLTRTKTRLRHRRSGLLVVAGSLILSWAAQLVLLIKIATCATHGRLNLFFLTFYVHWLLVLCAAYCPLIGFCIIFIIKAATEKILRIYHHPAPLQKIHQHWANWTRSARTICDGDNPAKILDALKDYLRLTLLFFPTLAGMVIFGAFLYFFYSRLLLFPPAGSSLMELDQAAALA